MPRPYPWLVTALVLCTACGGGGGGEPNSAGAIEPVLKAVEPPSPASTAVLAAAVPYLAEHAGTTTTVGRHGDPVPATPVEEEGSVTTSGIFDFFTAPFDVIGNLFGGGGGDDGPTLNDYFPTGTDDEWTYLGEAEILQGADPASLFPDLARGNKRTWGFTLQAQKEGLFFLRQEVSGGTITANPPLLWIRNKPFLATTWISSSELTYTPTGGGPPTTLHIDRNINGSTSQPHNTLHSSFADTVRVVVKDRVTDLDGTNARTFQYTYYLARGFGMVECTLARTIVGFLGSATVVGHAEIEWGRVNGQEGPDTDGDGIRDSLDLDDDDDGIPDDHLGSATPGDSPCTSDTVDCDDALPKDGTEQADADGDGLGNHTDPDGDNDSFANDGGGNGVEFDQPCTTTALGCDDAFPFDAAEWADADGDGIGNIADLDDDNDGRPDLDDPCPYTLDPCPAEPTSPSDPAGTTTPLATSGDPTPRGDLRFATFDPPQVNRRGEVGFQARTLPPGVAGEGTRGLFLADDNALATVARGGDPLPGGNGEVARTVDFALNDSGTVALIVTSGSAPDPFLPAPTTLLRGDATGLTEIARVEEMAPDGVGTLKRIDSIALNNAGTFAFRGSVKVGGDYLWVIYRQDETAATRVMIEGQPAPDGSGPLTPFGDPLLNDLGQVAFRATIGTEPFALDQAILLSTGTDLVTIAQHFLPLEFPEPRLNNRGEVVFLQGTLALGSPLGAVILRGDGSGLAPIVETGDVPADAQDPLTAISPEFALNDGGAVAFAGSTGEPATSDSREGIFVADNGAVQTIVHEGDPVPGGEGTFAAFRFGVPLPGPFGWISLGAPVSSPPPSVVPVFGRQVVPNLADRPLFPFVQLTEAGATAFRAAVGDTAVGMVVDQALFLGDPDETITAVRVATPLVGSRVAEIDDFALNDRGQVAYTALLADGREGLFLFTPDLHWRGGDGLWDDHTHWTIGLEPAEVHAVTLGRPVAVTGPAAPARVRGLTVTGGATLALHPGGPLTVAGEYTQEGSATLAVELAPGAAPAITTTGIATLAGTLRVTLASGVTPLPGDRFQVVSAAGGITGDFAAVDGSTIPTGLVLRVERDATTLTLVAALP